MWPRSTGLILAAHPPDVAHFVSLNAEVPSFVVSVTIVPQNRHLTVRDRERQRARSSLWGRMPCGDSNFRFACYSVRRMIILSLIERDMAAMRREILSAPEKAGAV